MLNIGKYIHSLADFKRRTSNLVERLQKTKRSIVLTVNGGPAVVVQDAAAIQDVLDRLEQLEKWQPYPRVASMWEFGLE